MAVFSPSERMGMIFPIIAGCLSAIAAGLVVSLAMRRWLRGISSGSQHRPDVSDNNLFLNLMLADFIQALGDVTTVWWLADGVVTKGHLCSAQAVFRQAGADGVAFSSMTISVYTFCVLVLRWSPPKYISRLVVLAIWISIALIVAIPYAIHRKEEFYGSVGYWCDVKTRFRTEQIFTKYIWLWGSLFFMAILYPIMFAVMRGWFTVENGVWYWSKDSIPERDAVQQPEEAEEEADSKAIANMFLLYPVPYFISIFPYSLTRWLFFYGHNVNYQATFFTTTLFALSGTFNAILFFVTRPDLVVGSTDSRPPTPLANTQIREREPKSPSSGLGTLPSRSPLAPDFEGNSSGHPYNSMLLTKRTNNNIPASPRGMEPDLDSDSPYWTGERSLGHGDVRSNPAPDMPAQEESYGHLPV